MSNKNQVTSEDLDNAICTILGENFRRTISKLIPRSSLMKMAMEKSWMTQRPEDEASAVLRQALEDLSEGKLFGVK